MLISQFWSVIKLLLPLLGHTECVVRRTGIHYKSLSGTTGVAGSMKPLVCFYGSWSLWRRCEEVEPQLLLWSELLAEQHLLVDRCSRDSH